MPRPARPPQTQETNQLEDKKIPERDIKSSLHKEIWTFSLIVLDTILFLVSLSIESRWKMGLLGLTFMLLTIGGLTLYAAIETTLFNGTTKIKFKIIINCLLTLVTSFSIVLVAMAPPK